MRAWLFPLCFAFAFGLVAPAPAQVPPEKAEATFTVAPELEFKLWASEPLFVNPTCIDIDHLGRLWVCESVNYRDTLHRRPLKRPEGDRILILEDSHGAGKADKVTVFYQAKEILAPLGIAVAKDPVGPGYKVYVCQSPDILLFEDKDGDGKADGPPWKLLTGFRGIDHDHGVHGILIGPDGKLYFSVGDQGVHDLQSSDGKGRKWSSNDTDCRAGTIWRCNLDGTGLELIAHNFRNEYEPCVDSFGNVFVSDNDDDGNQQTRICYVMRGGNYGYYPRGPGQSHWHEEQPGIVPKILRTGFGSPTGMCVYEGTLLPQKYWGQPLHTDAGPRHVRCYHLTPKGAGYDVEREDIVTSTDTWFRPSDICVAPDGSVFVADWYDPGVGGHGMGDTTRGRIYRLAPKGHKYHAPKVDLITKEGFLAALGSPNLAVRAMAILSVQRANAGANGDTTQWLDEALTQTRNPTLRARAAWLKFLPAGPGFEQELLALEKSGDPRFQILALRLLSQIGQRTNGGSRIDLGQSFLSALGATADPAVRAEALLLLAGQDPAKAKEPILKLAAGYDGKDRFYLEAVGIAVGHHDPNRREILLADFDQRFPDWNDKLANLIWELRPPAVLPRLEKLLTDGQTPVAQRRQIVEILAAASDGGAGETLLRVLRRPLPTEVRDRIVANFQQFLPGKWRGLRSHPELAETVEQLLASEAGRGAALHLIAAAGRVEAIPKVRALAESSQAPLAIRQAALEALGQIPSKDAASALAALTQPPRGAIAAAAARALGQQVPLWMQGPGTKTALQALETIVLANDADDAVREAAITTLAETQPGARWLLDRQANHELPADLVSQIGRLLRNSPHQDVHSRAWELFPVRKLDPAKLPDIAELARRRGNAAHGKEILAASVRSDLQCLKCHTIRGQGGNVGPDLSVIGKKASRENLFESILLPNKAIADQYVTWVVTTQRGQTLSGLLVEETPDHITLRDANAKDTRIARKEIDSKEKSPNSLMPSNLLVYMSEEDLVDIVEYLFGLRD